MANYSPTKLLSRGSESLWLFAFAIVTLSALCGCRKSAVAASSDPPNPDQVARRSAAPPSAAAVTLLSESPPGNPPGKVAPDAPRVQSTHQFYGVYVTGQKAGYAEEWVRPLPDGSVEHETQVVLTMQRLGQTLKLRLSDKAIYGPDGAMSRFETVEDLGPNARTVRSGRVEGDQLVVTVTTGGKSTEQRRAAPKERAEDTLPALMVPRLRAAGAEGTTFWQFDRSTLDDIEIKSRIVREREVRVSGVPTVVLEVDGRDERRGLTLGSRLTASGLALEMTVGPGFKLVLEEESVAKNPSLQVPDLYRLAVVPADKPLGRPDDVKRLRLALDGLPEAAGPSDGRQTRSEGSVLEVRRVDCKDVPKTAITAAERSKYLEATAFIDHAAPSVHARLASVATGPGRAERLSRLVTGALRYTLATAPMTASAIFEGGAGDCTEYARALVALLRADGIPAREVSGMAWSGDGEPGFAFHAWAEAYVVAAGESDGRWCALDPTWDQVTPDATHIALSRDDPTAIIGLLGGVKARIIDVER